MSFLPENIPVSNDSKRCICIFSALYAPHVGGVESYTKGIAEALAQRELRVIVVSMNTDDAISREFCEGVEIVRLPCSPFLNGRFPLPLRNQKSKELWNWLKEQSIDNIVINTRFYCLCTEAARFAKTRNIRPILIEHGSAHLTLGNKALDIPLHIVEHVMSVLIKRYKPICYAVSKRASDWLLHFGMTSQGEIPNAINADKFVQRASKRNFREEFNVPDDALLVAYAGRFVPEKGVMQLAKATAECDKNKLDIYTIMAGDGPLRESIKSLSSRRVIVPGALNKEDLAALLLQADAFCLPSRSEGFCTALLEAAACNCAIISTDVGGMGEIAPTNEYGLKLNSMNPSDIQASFEEISHSREHMRAIGENAARRVRQYFTWVQAADALIAACTPLK